jgi:hypothetical protein
MLRPCRVVRLVVRDGAIDVVGETHLQRETEVVTWVVRTFEFADPPSRARATTDADEAASAFAESLIATFDGHVYRVDADGALIKVARPAPTPRPG